MNKTRQEMKINLKEPKEQEWLNELIEESKFQKRGGKVADYIPELRLGLSSKVGLSICLAGEEQVFGFGDCYKNKRSKVGKGVKEGSIDELDRADDDMFSIQSISKVIALLYVLEVRGEEYVFKRVGKEPTGDKFNAPPRVKHQGDVPMPFNPLINVGAILITSMFPGSDVKEQFQGFFTFMKKLCGDSKMLIDEAVYESENKTGHNNRSLAWRMDAEGIFRHSDFESLDPNLKDRLREVERVEQYLSNYFRQCSVLVNTNHLARFASVLANGGMSFDGKTRHAKKENVHTVISLMSSCGMYDGSGEFAQEIGIPSKSGVGGGIMSVIPGVCGIATFCPALDDQGNSIRGIYMLEEISLRYNFSLFYKSPAIKKNNFKIDLAWIQKSVNQVSILKIPKNCKPFEYIPRLTSAKANNLEVSIYDLNNNNYYYSRNENQSLSSFSLQSICNVLALLYVLQNKSEGRVFEFVGKEPSGGAFNEIKWTKSKLSKKNLSVPFNPMINAGAIAIAAMVPSQYGENAKLNSDFDDSYNEIETPDNDEITNIPTKNNLEIGYLNIKDFLVFARKLLGNEKINVKRDVFESERSTGYNNRSIAWEMNDKHIFDDILATHYINDNKKIDNNDIEDILGVYFQLCSIEVTVKDLAHFSAILANGGKDIKSDKYLLSPREVAIATSLLSTSGLYDGSGEYSCLTGIPSKSGASGGLIGIVPGKLGIATYSPTIDPKGNSFYGMKLMEKISKEYNLSIFSANE